MAEGLKLAKQIVEERRDEAERERLFHKMTKPHLQNVEATLAACKKAWFEIIIRDIEAEENRLALRT